jgi:two-component system chemotaxis response regulator CheB
MFPKAAFDIVAIAASAGGLESIIQVLSDLPADFPAAVVVIQHLDPRRPSMLVNILARKTGMSVVQAGDHMVIHPGTVYIAPPNHHLAMDSSRELCLTRAAPVHFVRPSADVLFQTMAVALQGRLIAVVLSGSGVDGAIGVQEVKKMGGTVLVQEEATALFAGMPHAAIITGIVDRILPLKKIAPTILELITPGGAHDG